MTRMRQSSLSSPLCHHLVSMGIGWWRVGEITLFMSATQKHTNILSSLWVQAFSVSHIPSLSHTFSLTFNYSFILFSQNDLINIISKSLADGIYWSVQISCNRYNTSVHIYIFTYHTVTRMENTGCWKKFHCHLIVTLEPAGKPT